MSAKKLGRSRKTAPIDFPEAMVFRPTMEEFADFNGYVAKMEAAGAHHAGIAKIIPPAEWIPRQKGYDVDGFEFKIDRPLKQSFANEGCERGAYQTKCANRQPMTVKEYREMANSRIYRTPPHTSHEDLERKYWKSLNFGEPIYGADVTATITDPEVKEFNIAKLDTILKYVEEDTQKIVYGVNSPYLYFGMWKATFSWHVEDMDLYGINFLHHGDPKTWYCVPPKYGYLLERAAKELFPNIAGKCSNFMRHKKCLISPSLLEELGVPFQKMVQEERAIIVVFPYAYHAGFNHGWNIAESTNFASPRWVEYGKRHRPCDCSVVKVQIDMGIFVKRLQPELYEKWVAGKDIAPHPEDPEDVASEVRKRAANPEAYAKMLQEKMEKDELHTYKSPHGRRFKFNVKKMMLQGNAQLSKEEENHFKKWKETNYGHGSNKTSAARVIETYQLVDMPKVRVKVNRDTMRCMHQGLDLLRDHLDRPELTGVLELIAKGELVKIGQKTIVKQFTKKTINKLQVYEHAESGLRIRVTPVNKKPVGGKNEALLKLLEGKSVQEAIAAGVLTYVETVPYAPSGVMVKKTVNCKIYANATGDVSATVTPDLQLVGKINPELKALLDETPLSELIDKGMLVLIGEKVLTLETAGGERQKRRSTIFRSYAVTGETVEAVDVAISVARVAYRFKYDGSAGYDFFVRNTFENLLSAKSLQEKEEKVSNPEELKKLLSHNLKYGNFAKYQVGDTEEIVRAVGGNLLANDKSKHAELFAEKTLKELEDTQVLKNKEEYKDLCNKKNVKMALFGDAKVEEDQLSIQYDERTHVAVIINKTSGMAFVVRDEATMRTNKRFGSSSNYGPSKRARSEGPMVTLQVAEMLRIMKSKEEEKVELNIDVLVEEEVLNRDTLTVVVPILTGLEMFRLEEGSSNPIWMPNSAERIRDRLNRLLLNNGVEEEEQENTNVWSICADVLRYFMFLGPKHEIGQKALQARVRPCSSLVEKAVAQTQLRVVCEVLAGLGLLTFGGKSGLVYSGPPDIYTKFERDQLNKFGGKDIRSFLRVPLERATVEEDVWDRFQGGQSQRIVRDYSSLKKSLIADTVSKMELTEEQERSFRNLDVSCKCGLLVERAEELGGTKRKVTVGTKKKARCKQCANCLAPKCMQCENCLIPSRKQACIKKICLFPKVPDCPCFK